MDCVLLSVLKSDFKEPTSDGLQPLFLNSIYPATAEHVIKSD